MTWIDPLSAIRAALGFSRLLPKPPVLRLEPGSAIASDPRWLLLRVINESKRTLQVNGYWLIPWKSGDSKLRVYPSGQSRYEWRTFHEQELQRWRFRKKNWSFRQKSMPFHLPGESEHVLRVGPVNEGCTWIVVVWWRRNFGPSIPALIVITRPRAEMIDESRKIRQEQSRSGHGPATGTRRP